MDYEKEIVLLKHQIDLLTHVVSGMENIDEYSFFMMLLDYRVTKHQTDLFIDMLRILNMRRKGIYSLNEMVPNNDEQFHEKRLEESRPDYAQYGISMEELFKESPPTYEEFTRYTSLILKHDQPKWVLSSLKKQYIMSDLCDFLMSDMESRL